LAALFLFTLQFVNFKLETIHYTANLHVCRSTRSCSFQTHRHLLKPHQGSIIGKHLTSIGELI